MTLILLSSLISLLTIGIYFLKYKNSKLIKIPSWFLGGKKDEENFQNIKLIKPPIIPILLIILFTIILGYLYKPQNKNTKDEITSNNLVIWLDPSLNTKAYAQKNINISKISDNILSINTNIFGLKNIYSIKDGVIDIKHELIPLDNKNNLENFLISEINSPPSPFIMSLNIENILNILHDNSEFNKSKNSIFIISDGQFSSLHGFSLLKKYFNNSYFLSVLNNDKLQVKNTEIIPDDLISSWTNTTSDPTANQKYSIYNENLNIPPEARSNLGIKEIQNTKIKYISNFDELKYNSFFVICSDNIPSPNELDAFSNLKVFVKFIGYNIIEKPCTLRTQENIKKESDPWGHRNSTVWVVPFQDKVINEIFDNLKFWVPHEFNENYDTLVYVSGNLLNINSFNELKQIPIQLDENASLTPLYLSPPPPRSDITLKSHDNNLVYLSNFKPFLNSYNGIELAWKAKSLPIYYLRTGISSPNGQLSRSELWTKFWLDVTKSLKQTNISYTEISFDDIYSLQKALEENVLFTNSKFDLILDSNSLLFQKAKNIQLGLYKMSANNDYILITPPKKSFEKLILTTEEMNTILNEDPSFQKSSENETNNKFNILSLFLGLASFILLALLWWRDNKIILKNINIILILLIMPLFSSNTFAQTENKYINQFSFSNDTNENSKSTSNIPFRISWCDETIPDYVENHYINFRNLLAFRGTITLPKKLLAKSCSVGKSEIWWTDNPKFLKVEDLKKHIANGGIFILEGTEIFPYFLLELENIHIGLQWNSPQKRGMFYRSFYLIQSLDGCLQDTSKVLMMKRKENAESPFGIVISSHFLSDKEDCFKNNTDYKKSLINIFYSFLTTDYKEDQLNLPELLNRIKNLGLEP